MLKPDAHTVSTSDLFFVAHKLDRASTIVGEIARLEAPDVVVLDDASTTLHAATVVKCVGFHTNEQVCDLLGRTHFRGLGLVDDNLWFCAEPHLDAGTFSLPFGSSFLNGAQFTARMMAKTWRDPECTRALLDALPCAAPLATFTATDMFDSIVAAQAARPDVSDDLHDHLEQVRLRFEAAMPFAEYLRRNALMWEDYHTLLRASTPASAAASASKHLAWRYGPLEAVVREEVAAAVTAAAAATAATAATA